LHAEDFGWPLKKTDKTINANNNSKVQALYGSEGLAAAA